MGDKGRTDDQELASVAASQHGVVSVRQLGALGLTRNAVAKRAAAGRLHRIHRGVYAVGHANLTWHGRALAAVLASEPAVLSHHSAGWLWGLLRTRPGALHVTAPTRRRAKPRSGDRRSRPTYTVHFAGQLDEDRDRHEGIPVTSVARTLLDLAGSLSAYRLERTIERAEERGRFDLRSLEALLDRAGHHAGAGALRRALAIYRDEPAVIRSRLEKRFLKKVLASKLPRPATNFHIAGFERDRLRQEELKLAGIEMIRVTGPRFDREPEAVIERLAALLAQRRHSARLN